MSRATVILHTVGDRALASEWIAKAPIGTTVTFKTSKRSVPQNSRMWAMLTEVSQQVPWHGVRLDPADWKLVFLDALKRELRMVPNLEGNGFVQLGRSSSDLTKEEMSGLLELIAAFGARQGVKFKDEAQAA